MNKANLTLIILSVVVGVTMIYALMNGGSPTAAKNKRFDNERMQHLQSLKNWVNSYYETNKTMPVTLADLTAKYNNQLSVVDPETKVEYGYEPRSGTQYELCMTFATDTTTNQLEQALAVTHPAGYYCYNFDATKY